MTTIFFSSAKLKAFSTMAHGHHWAIAYYIDDLKGNEFDSIIWIHKIANGIFNSSHISQVRCAFSYRVLKTKKKITLEQTDNYMEDCMQTGNSASKFPIQCDVFKHRVNFKLHSFDRVSSFFYVLLHGWPRFKYWNYFTDAFVCWRTKRGSSLCQAPSWTVSRGHFRFRFWTK